MLPEDIEQMVTFLGRNEPGVRKLIQAYRRNPELAASVRHLLKRRCMQAGFDPDDPPVFWPPRTLPPGDVPLGGVPRSGGPALAFALPERALTTHVGIFGQAGTGKSFLAMHGVTGVLEAGHRVWILDVEDEYRRLIPPMPAGALTTIEPEQLRLNLLEPPGPWITPVQWLDEVSLLLRGQTYLRDGSLNLFRSGMGRLLERKAAAAGGERWPCLVEAIEHFGGMGFGPKARRAGWLESLLNRLGMLADAFGPMARVQSSSLLPTLASQSVVFRLSRLTGVPLQFLVSFLLLWLTRYREGPEADDKVHVVVVEEPHMLTSDKSRTDVGESALCRTFRTARKRGVGLVLCDQVPSQLPQPILANLGCRVVMRLVNARCIWSLQSSMGLKRLQAEAISELEPRQAVVQYAMHPTPFLMEVPALRFPEKPSASALRPGTEALLGVVRWTEYRPESAEAAGAGQASALGAGDLGGDPLLVMVRICETPAEPIEVRCNALGLDRSREFRARGELDSRGLIEEASETVAGKIKFFQPTEKGLDWARRHKVKVKTFKSGLVHEYLLTRVERGIGGLGPKWRLQRNSSIAREQGLQPDMLVLGPEGRRVIVEVVCNNLDYDAENIVAEAAIADLDGVLAVTPDKRTMDALERAIQKQAGEEWPPTVSLVHAGQCLAPTFDWRAALTPAGASGTGREKPRGAVPDDSQGD